MTPDQIWFRLCDIEIFKMHYGRRTKQVKPGAIAGSRLKGVSHDGKLMEARVGGKTKLQLIQETQRHNELPKDREVR